MQKYVIMVTVLILLAPLVGAGDPFKVVTDVPQFVKPGDTFTISISVQNKTGSDQRDIKVSLLASSPFDVVGDDVFILGTFDEFIDMRMAVFKLHVRENASYGYYDIPYIIKNQNVEYRDMLKIHVLGTTLVNIPSISVDKEKVFPGDTFLLMVSVENKGENRLKWIKISLNCNPSSLQNSPLVPLTTTEAVFLNMKRGAREETSFTLSVGKDTQPGSYPLLLVMSYEDEAELEGEYEVPYGIEVLGKANIVFSSIEPDPMEPTQNKTIVLNVSLKNVGEIEAKSVKGTAVSKGGKYTAFLPDIAKDESGSLAFNVGTLGPGEHDFTISIQWVDEYGQSGEIDENYVLMVKREERSYTSFIVGGVIVLVVAAAYFLKKRSK
jgi:hypothetical protein